jgi:hypothetical protein
MRGRRVRIERVVRGVSAVAQQFNQFQDRGGGL